MLTWKKKKEETRGIELLTKVDKDLESGTVYLTVLAFPNWDSHIQPTGHDKLPTRSCQIIREWYTMDPVLCVLRDNRIW